ncbi:MAG: ribosomal protein S18-alanine N-acetyltransferase [Parvularculaceae bacterium]
MTGWSIREGAKGEETLLADLEAFAFGEKSWGANAVKESFVASRVTVLFGARGDEAPAGFAVWRDLGPEAELLTIGVLPAFRGLGLGTALLGAVMDAARAAGAQKLFLEVGADNHAARGLYERAGFAEVSIRRAYYRDGADALVMARTL